MQLLFLILSALCSIQAIDWQSGDNGQIQWSSNCDFNGNDIGNVKGRGEDCGGHCIRRSDCSTFAWNAYEGGTCWLKSGGEAHYAQDTTCGKVVNRNSNGNSGGGGINWQSGDNGQVQWSSNCDFNGNDIGNVKSNGEECGGHCIRRSDCSTFAWNAHEGGTCWLKSGGEAHYAQDTTCGKIVNRNSNGGGGGGGINWQSGDNGQIQWSSNCDFNGNDIGNVKGRGEDCGGHCIARQDCSTFAWNAHEGGTCWLKSGGEAHYAQDTTCGKVVNRNSNGGINWQSGDDGQVQWSSNCDFNGNDIGNVKSNGEECGGHCIRRSDCSTFAWNAHEGGTCWLKSGGEAHYAQDTTCGKIVKRNELTVNLQSGTGGGGGGGAGGAVEGAINIALQGLGIITSEADRFNSGVGSNQCKFSIAHYGKSGKNGFRTEWETAEGDINKNDETLNGYGHQVDTSRETLTGAGRLAIVRFHPYGNPCVKAITISCGPEAVKGGGYLELKYQHMRAAWFRLGNTRMIEMDWQHECIHFNRDGLNNGFKAMDIRASIFDCTDHNCIQQNLEMF